MILIFVTITHSAVDFISKSNDKTSIKFVFGNKTIFIICDILRHNFDFKLILKILTEMITSAMHSRISRILLFDEVYGKMKYFLITLILDILRHTTIIIGCSFHFRRYFLLLSVVLKCNINKQPRKLSVYVSL